MSDKNRIDEYKIILSRLEKAEKYFKEINNEQIDNIESSKAYLKMVELIYRANELYIELRESNINV